MDTVRENGLGEIVHKLLAGDRRAAARLISLVENRLEEANYLMKLVYPHTGKAMIIGITGSGGSGKSSLINQLIKQLRRQDKKVSVLAVDPSSPFSGGALLGDRIRFQKHSMDKGVYIRSMGSRGYLGGLARSTTDVVRIMEAMGNDVIIIETLGVGQDEIDIIHIAQTCILVLTPGMGDGIQAMKAGIMEVADLIVLNKADLEGADVSLRTLESTLHYTPGKKKTAWSPRIIPTVAVSTKSHGIQGIDELVEAIIDHQTYIRDNQMISEIHTKRIEQELSLIFKDEVEKLVFAGLKKLVFAGLKGTGKKRRYIDEIMTGRNDPYSVVLEVLKTLFPNLE
jgi:LAO/AO transport system kinase